MAVSGFVKTNVSGSISLADGTGTPLTLALLFDRGDLQVTGIKEVLNEDVAIERRGNFINAAHGNRTYPQLSFSSWISQFQAAADPGDIVDWILRQGAYSAAVSTLGAGSKVPFASDVTYNLEGTDFNDSADHDFTLHDVQFNGFDFQESESGLFVSISGIVRGEIDGDLTAAEYA